MAGNRARDMVQIFNVYGKTTFMVKPEEWLGWSTVRKKAKNYRQKLNRSLKENQLPANVN